MQDFVKQFGSGARVITQAGSVWMPHVLENGHIF